MFQQALELGLKSYGYEIAAAGSGVDGLEFLLDQKFDLVLADLLMHVMDGLNLATQLKGRPLTRDIPIALMSGRKLGAHVDEHHVFATALTKPLSLEELLKVIVELVPR